MGDATAAKDEPVPGWGSVAVDVEKGFHTSGCVIVQGAWLAEHQAHSDRADAEGSQDDEAAAVDHDTPPPCGFTTANPVSDRTCSRVRRPPLLAS